MLGNNLDNRFVKVKVVGVNTVGKEKLSGGLAALNCILEKNLPGVNYLAVDRNDIKNLDGCNTIHKLRLLDRADEQNLVQKLRGADMIFVVAEEVWENIKAVALAAHCAKKVGVPVIFIAGGNFEDAEDEIIFDALIKLPNKNFEFDSSKVVENFIEAVTLDGQPKIDVKIISETVAEGGAIIGYGERDGKNSVVKAAKAALEHAENSAENFKTAKKILFNVTAAKGNLSLEEAQKLSRLIKRRAPDAEISFGFSIDDWLVSKVKFLLIAASV
ncbi:MAG: hypothetical protein II857_10525 [Selenomonadaceae bacterium]|nr:hypothetical protein [Selenomonadaceae bacterium]